jgi:hypothetical protein
MAAPLLIGLGKALLSQAPKIAAKQLGKKAVKNAAKDFVKGKVKDKLKGKKKKKGGALVRSEDITSTGEQVNETAQKISPQKLLPSSVDTTTSSAVISPSGKTSYEKISQRLDNIIGITGALDKAFKQQLKDKKKTAKATQNARQTERKKAREEKLEQGKKSLGIGAAAMSAAKKFGLMDFITNVLLGGLILFLLKQAPKIEKIFNFLTENLYASFLIIRGVLQAFKGAFKQFGKIVRGILKTGVRIATKPFRMAGSAIASGFRRLGNAIFNFARMGLNLIRRGLRLRPIPKSPDKGKGRGQSKGRFEPKSKTKSKLKSKPRAKPRSNILSKLFGNNGAKDLAKAKGPLSRVSRLAKGIRIPILGPFIVAITSMLAGDPVGKTIFKAVGAGLGEALGTLIPIPIVGTIIGGLIGEYGGDLLYTLLYGGGMGSVANKINKDFQKALDVGGQAIDFLKSGFSRLITSFPVVIIPEGGGRRSIATQVTKLIPGLFDFLKSKNYVDGKGQVTKFPDIGKFFSEPQKTFGLLKKSFFPASKTQPEQPAVVTISGDSESQTASTTSATGPEGYTSSTTSATGPEGYTSSLMPKSKKSKFYAAMGINEQMWKTYKDTIASIETSGYSLDESYKAIGGSGGLYDGRYQMGKMARIDAAQALGIPTPSRFELRNNPQLQEDMFLAYTYKNYTYMSGASTQFDNASNVQKLQYLGYAHNQGHAYATDWLKTGVISSVDGFGTKGTKFTDKLAKTLKPYLSGEQPQQSTQSQQLQTSPISDRKPTPDNSDKLKPTSEQQQTATPVQPSSSTASQNASQVSRSASYEDGAEQTIVIPSPSQQQQQPMMAPQQSGSVIKVGGSTKDVLNSYYKAQLLGFLYKQG